MNKYLNKNLIKIIISTLLLIISFFLNQKVSLYLLIISYIIISYEIYIDAVKNIIKGEIFDENFLMIIATIGAFIIDNKIEAVLVMLLFEIGEYFSDLAINKSKQSITSLLDIRVEKVHLLEKDVSIKKVKENDIFIVKPGERIPLDGIIIEGESFLDTSSLTGESVPQKVIKNDSVLSGSINQTSILKIKATSNYKNSTAQRIVELVEKSESKKSNTENFIRRFSKIYTPIICIIGLLIVVVPSLIGLPFNTWLYRGLIFLVTACPCALVISAPLGYFCGIGKAAKEGIIIKGAKKLEKIDNIDYLFLDKTGTITEGVFEITKIKTSLKRDEFLNILASAEANSTHPIAKAILKENTTKLKKITNYQELPGKGIKCQLNNDTILIGNEKLMTENSILFDKSNSLGTTIYLAINNKYKGFLVISDRIRESSGSIKDLKNYITKDIIILSGDNDTITKKIAQELKINKYYAKLLPTDKANIVKEYKQKGKVAFLGDGINDALVIKVSDIGISMGNLGSDAAIEASDVVLMTDDLHKIKDMIEISKITKRKVKESIIFALTIKILVLILSIFGLSTILLAVFADVGVTFLAILNVLSIFYLNHSK